MSAITTGQTDGFEWHELASESLAVRIVPALGAKITSLRNLRTGREWMWRPPDTPRLFASPLGTAFADGTKWGGDECIPTIGACSWKGRALPDHGEAWTEAWEAERTHGEPAALVTRLRLPVSPLAIERSASVRDGQLRLGYALTNVGALSEDYVWALHPMLALQPGDRLVLPDTVRAVRPHLQLPEAFGPPSSPWTWPRPFADADLSSLDLGGASRAVKCFTEPGQAGWARVENERAGDMLEFRFDPGQLNTLGIWINQGGWSGYRHLALEPASGAPDPLTAAVQDWRRHATLAPGETKRWEVEIEAGQRLP